MEDKKINTFSTVYEELNALDEGYSDQKNYKVAIELPIKFKLYFPVRVSFGDSISFLDTEIDTSELEQAGIDISAWPRVRIEPSGTYKFKRRRPAEEIANEIKEQIKKMLGPKFGELVDVQVDDKALLAFAERCTHYNSRSSGEEEPLTWNDMFDGFAN